MVEHIQVEINGKKYSCDPEDRVLDACRNNGIFVPTLCEIEEIEQPFGGCRVCLVEVTGPRGTMVTTSCDTPVAPDMVIHTDTPQTFQGRKTAIELLLSEHTGDCVAPCSRECPTSLDVQGYLAHIANGRPIEAVKLIKEKTPLAISLGRACFAPCEEECRRVLVEDPIAIRQEKQYAAEIDILDPWTPEIPKTTGKKIAIVGGGPAGLTAAYFLRLGGHNVTIYDMMPKLGGMMRYGIPHYRLPKDLLDKEIDWITGLGIDVKPETKLGENITIEELRAANDAVFVATGAWESWIVPIEGKDLPRVYGGIDFLVDFSLGKEIELGERVLVVGCGNTAMDVARTARRMGKEVTIAYRRTSEEAPASIEEREEAEEEGIKFMYLTNPEKICGCQVNGVNKVECARMELGEPDASGRPRPIKIQGEPLSIESDSVILAIGQSPDLETLKKEGLETAKYTMKCDSKFMTNIEGVFTAGDGLIGPSSIVECTGQAREAAFAIHAYLEGKLDSYQVPEDYRLPFGYIHVDEKSEEDFADWNRIPRALMPKILPEERVKDFRVIELGFEDKVASKEADRCLECGCLDRFQCKLKEYATIYGAKQDTYHGFKNQMEIDQSHPHIIRDPGKCVLCGSCVRTTEELNEGVVQFANRGFVTVVEPAFGAPLGSVDSQLIGALADACPTGAIEEIPKGKPGPFKLEELGKTICPGCGIGCDAKLLGYDGIPVKLIPHKPTVHLCDKGKFSIPDSGSHTIDGQMISSYLNDGPVDIYVSGNVTLEELECFKNIAQKTGGNIYSPHAPKVISNVGLNELLDADKIFVQDGAYLESPLLKYFVKKALDRGAQKVSTIEELDHGVAVLKSDSDIKADKRIVSQRYLNSAGLYGLTSKGEGGRRVLLYGLDSVDMDTKDTLVVKEDMNWLAKKGTFLNIFGDKVELQPLLQNEDPLLEISQRM